MKCLGASQLRQISQDIHAPTLTYFFPGDTSDLRPCLMSYSCSGYLGLCQTLCTSLRVCSFRWKHSDLEEEPGRDDGSCAHISTSSVKTCPRRPSEELMKLTAVLPRSSHLPKQPTSLRGRSMRPSRRLTCYRQSFLHQMLTSNQRRLDANKLLRCSVASGLLSQQRYEARHEDTQVVCRLVYLVANHGTTLRQRRTEANKIVTK